MPGGESTTISLVASHTPGLLEGLKAFVQDPEKAVWGTCAGMILMSDTDRGIGGGKIRKVDGGSLGGWGGIKGLRVWRNLYGGTFFLEHDPFGSGVVGFCYQFKLIR